MYLSLVFLAYFVLAFLVLGIGCHAVDVLERHICEMKCYVYSSLLDCAHTVVHLLNSIPLSEMSLCYVEIYIITNTPSEIDA